MWSAGLVLVASLGIGAPPPARVAVLIDDPAPSEPTRAAVEIALQGLGYEVVSREQALQIRAVITPQAVLDGKLPADLSVLEADAIFAGQAAYGEPIDVEGVKSLQVALSTRLLDLATSRVSATQQSSGVGLGNPGPNLAVRGAQQAVGALFARKPLTEALAALGQQAGAVTLVVQGLPSRKALGDLRAELERALAGAPAREIYFAQGMGKLLLGGSAARSMSGPEVADVLSADRKLALEVTEVANTRIVARYAPARAVSLTALVLEPKVSPELRGEREALGRYVAGEVGKFGFLEASYQAGALTRARAIERAKALKADLVVESELLVSGKARALAIRVVDVSTGQLILREQKPLEGDVSRFAVAESMLGAIKTQLPERLAARRPTGSTTEPAVAGATK